MMTSVGVDLFERRWSEELKTAEGKVDESGIGKLERAGRV